MTPEAVLALLRDLGSVLGIGEKLIALGCQRCPELRAALDIEEARRLALARIDRGTSR